MSYFNIHSYKLRSLSKSDKQNLMKTVKTACKKKQNNQYPIVKKKSSAQITGDNLSLNKLTLNSPQKKLKFKARSPPTIKKCQKPFQQLNMANQYYEFQLPTNNSKKLINRQSHIKNNIASPSLRKKSIKATHKMKSDEESTKQFRGNPQYQNKIKGKQFFKRQNKLDKNEERHRELSISLLYKEEKKKADCQYLKERLKKQIHCFRSLQKNHEIQYIISLNSEYNSLNEAEKNRLAKIQKIQKKQLADSIFTLKDKLEKQVPHHKYY